MPVLSLHMCMQILTMLFFLIKWERTFQLVQFLNMFVIDVYGKYKKKNILNC